MRNFRALWHVLRSNGVAMPDRHLHTYIRKYLEMGGTLRHLRTLARITLTPATLAWSMIRDWRARLADYAQLLRAREARRTRTRDWWLPDSEPAPIGSLAHRARTSPSVARNAGEALLGALGIQRPTQSNLRTLRACGA